MSVFTINNVDMPSPSEMSVRISDIGDFSRRDIAGDAVADRLSVKREISLSWAYLTGAQLSLLLGAAGETVFFTAVYPDPETGASRSGVFRAVSRAAEAARGADGTIYWTNVELELEER